MTGRIVVGIDGSSASANALEWAVSRALLGGEDLELVSAYSITPALDFYGYSTMTGTQPVDWYAEYAQQVLQAGAARVAEVAPSVTCTTRAERSALIVGSTFSSPLIVSCDWRLSRPTSADDGSATYDTLSPLRDTSKAAPLVTSLPSVSYTVLRGTPDALATS